MDNNKRPDDMIRITTEELAAAFIEEQVAGDPGAGWRTKRYCWPCPAA